MLGQDDLGGMDRNEIQDMVRAQDTDVIDSVRLVFSDESSNKFYEIGIEEHDGAAGERVCDVPFRFGKLGSSGQTGYKARNTDLDVARKAFDKAVKEKLGKGYKEEWRHGKE
jgi:predicted DNA-binding WGR domain protein